MTSVGICAVCQDWKQQWIWTTVSEVQMLCLLVILMWLWRPVDENKTCVASLFFYFCAALFSILLSFMLTTSKVKYITL